MTAILRTVEQLEACPLGTEATDNEGDVVRRVAAGWTYRPRHVAPGATVTSHGMLQYAPLVCTGPAPQPLLVKLDDPALHADVWAYLEKYPRSSTGPHRAAKDILALVKKAVQA